jgi:MOSC domain-containing protein YiiM
MPTLLSVQTGRVGRLGPNRVRSGFVKLPMTGPVAITARGLAGDEQADLAVHGDAAKAVYGYAAESYEDWRASHPQHAALWRYGGLAENLTLAGLHEDEVCIGDTMRVGAAVLQVTQPREPCFKFALRFGDPLLPKAMIANGRSGWYYRVIEPGEVAAGDAVSLLKRLNPDWTISRMNRFIHAKRRPRDEIEALMALPGLAETWPPRLAKLATG